MNFQDFFDDILYAPFGSEFLPQLLSICIQSFCLPDALQFSPIFCNLICRKFIEIQYLLAHQLKSSEIFNLKNSLLEEFLMVLSTLC